MKLFVGYTEQYNARPVNIDISNLKKQWPDAVPTLMVMRPNDNQLHPVVSIVEDDILTWIPNESETQNAGDGCAVIFMYSHDNSYLGKSRTYITQVVKSPNAGGTTPSPPIQPYIVQVLSAKQEFDRKSKQLVDMYNQVDKKFQNFPTLSVNEVGDVVIQL